MAERDAAEVLEESWLTSAVARWMRGNRDALADFAEEGATDWAGMAAAFRVHGIFTGLGDLPSAAFLAETWRRVEATAP